MLRNYFKIYLVISIPFLALYGCTSTIDSDLPYSEEAISSVEKFEIADGFKLELIAGEPLVFDPVDMMIDEYGRMYVVEMPGVPYDLSGTGKVVILTDTDGDGKMDKRTVFADSLSLPTGITKWKNGVIVTDPPNVYYFEDTDGDDIADVKELMMTNFDTSNFEANVNNPEYHLNNWIYLADLPVGGPGNIHFLDDPEKKGVPESSMRIKPDEFKIETLSGQTQFGQAFDLWGHHFMQNSNNHLFQNVFPNEYIHRNPNLVITNANNNVAKHNKVFPVINPEFQMLSDIGIFTSACALTYYHGNSFPDGYNDNITFVCEPANNIVHVDRLESSGVSFDAIDILGEKEFLAAKDPHSRIVNLYVGPDGALYILDMYRQIIEGPQFIAQEVLDTVDLYHGNTKGRVYRVSSKETPFQDWMKGLDLGNKESLELVNKLEDKNGWWRINAQRLLVDRKDKNVVKDLENMVLSGGYAPGRVHALWTLEGMKELRSDIVESALQDEEEGVRENAIKLAESYLQNSPRLAEKLLELKEDPSLRVKFQLLLTLGNVHSEVSEKAKLDILFKNIDDEWIQLAALSDSKLNAIAILERMMGPHRSINGDISSLVQKVSSIIGIVETPKVVTDLIRKGVSPLSHKDKNLTSSLLNGLADGLRNRGTIEKAIKDVRGVLMKAALSDSVEEIRDPALRVLEVMGLPGDIQVKESVTKAIAIIKDENKPADYKVQAINFIALSNPVQHLELLKDLLDPKKSKEVQIAAVRALRSIPGVEFSNYLLGNWKEISPGVKEDAIETFLITDERIVLLLDAVDNNQVNLSDFTWMQSVRLRSLGNMDLRQRSRELFSKQEEGLSDIIKEYQSALTLDGDASKGKVIYQKNCAMCHQMEGGMGRHIGPDLGTVRPWNTADIMANIIDPNRSIAIGYDTWNVHLTNGKSIQGVILEETSSAIVMNDANYEKMEISRKNIESMESMGTSIMPMDFGEKISKQEMADLLEFIKRG